MLTKDLLVFTQRQGKIRPRFVTKKDEDVPPLAEDLVGILEAAPGVAQGDLDEALMARTNAHRRPAVARGLAKLLLDRVEIEAADEAAPELRQSAFGTARDILAGLEDEASFEAYEAALQAKLPAPLAEVRHGLYADLPDRRHVVGWEALTAEALVERYNLALAQGLVMYAHRVTVRAERPDLVTLRRLLRWLKFCRLVSGVARDGDALVIDAEGPAAVLSSSRKYGLQLAMFLMAVPLLKRFEVTAEVQLPRRPKATLTLTHKDPLVSTLQAGLGHVPEELQAVADLFAEGAWRLDTLPDLRPVGATGTCVPDFSLTHAEDDRTVAVELFHAWHRSMLDRRLEELRERPDPDLLLGVDRSLAKKPEAKARLEAEPQVFLFNAFPTQKVLMRALKRLGGA